MKPINGTGMKRAALINDLSCFGKCSLSVALPIVSAYGAEAVALPTAVLSTHTGGFEGYVVHDMTDEMKSFAAHWKRMDMKFNCIATGFFCSVEQIRIAEKFIRDFADENTIVFVDPVLGDNGKLYGCFNDDFVVEMRRLCELAQVVTPNVTEAALLTGCPMDTPAQELLAKLKMPNAVVTGVRSGEKIGYRARFGEELAGVDKAYAPMQLHGTGDVFSAAYCGELLCGKSWFSALAGAADFVDACIRRTAARQPAHWYGLAFEDVLKERVVR